MGQISAYKPLPDEGTLSVFQPGDLVRMRHAVDEACREAAVEIGSKHCFDIARKIVSSYRPGLSDQELLAAALSLFK